MVEYKTKYKESGYGWISIQKGGRVMNGKITKYYGVIVCVHRE